MTAAARPAIPPPQTAITNELVEDETDVEFAESPMYVNLRAVVEVIVIEEKNVR